MTFRHPRFTRRTAIRTGSIGLLGLGTNHLSALREAAADESRATPVRSVIYVFLSGGLAQQDSFDLKPEASDKVRGEFDPIATATPGIDVCEHLPLLAARSERWSLVRSLTHPHNEHSDGHHVMLTGRTELPRGFDRSKPKPTDYPSIASIVGDVTRPRNNLPPAVALPERLVHRTGRVIPGQFGGEMGPRKDPWFIQASPFHAATYGAYPEFEFHHERGREVSKTPFQAPNLSLPETLGRGRLFDRLSLLETVERQRRDLDRAATIASFDRYRQGAVDLLTEGRVRDAFDVTRADDATQDRYGRNSYGWSLLMAKRLVEAGVNLVQVNLGNNESWDTHQNAFPNLRDFLFPPTDRAMAALLDDLAETGLLENTLVVMAGEFGRTPRIFTLPKKKRPGRDHWGAVQTVFLAGGGVQGGTVVGASDAEGGYPADDPWRPENLAATIYESLGLPRTVAWHDDLGRPHHVYHGDPIAGLT